MRWSDRRAQLETEREAVKAERKQVAKSLSNAPSDETGDAARSSLLAESKAIDDREAALVGTWDEDGDFAWQKDPTYLAMVTMRDELFASTSESWRSIRAALNKGDPHDLAKIHNLSRDNPMSLDDVRHVGTIGELATLRATTEAEYDALAASDVVAEWISEYDEPPDEGPGKDQVVANLLRSKSEELTRMENLLQALDLLDALVGGEVGLRAKYLPD